jgi:hypothetical protein
MTDIVLNGSLSAFKLADVLTFLHTSHKTGMLTLANGASEGYVFFRRGELVYAASNQESLRLGATLLRRKKITREQATLIDESLTVGGRLGDIAVKEGILTSDELSDALKLQIAAVVFEAFMWNEGAFSFYDAFDLPANAVTISIDLSNLIMEGARRIEEWEHCLALLPDSSVVFRVVSTPDTEKITLTLDEWKILFMINGQRSLEQICRDAGDDVLSVYRVVYGLSANKLIEPVPERYEKETEQPQEGTAPLAAQAPDGDATIRQMAAEFESTLREVRDLRGPTTDDTNLLISSEAKLSYRDVVKQTVSQLTIVAGEPMGATFPLTNAEYTMGRHLDNSIRLTDVGVSGHHARIYRGPEGYVVEDLKSRNGIWINGDRVYHSVLKHGDRLQLGGTDLDYTILFGA